MSLELQFEASLRLLLAMTLSMVIGLDRDRRSPAGLRTHMLVGLGACLFTLVSIYAFPSGDPARVAAQIVAGIGFLGAGVIMQQRSQGGERVDVKHLTTAASIWFTAAVGMTVGAGAGFLATTATLIAWIVLDVVRRFEPDK